MGSFRKAFFLPVSAFIVLLTGAPVWAAAPPANLPEPPPLPEEMLKRRPTEPPPDLPDPSELIAQLQQLEELLSLPPEKLQKLRETIEFIEKMSPGEREAMRIRLTQVTRMTGALRQEIDSLSTLVPEVSKSNLSQFWLAASEEERAGIRDRLEALSSVEKRNLLTQRIATFVTHRDEVFARMKESLESKRKAAAKPDN